MQECSIITRSAKFLLIFKNSIAAACYLIFSVKTKRPEIIFRDLLKSVEKKDSQIISWRDSKSRNSRGTTRFSCLSHSNCRNVHLIWKCYCQCLKVSFPVLFDRFNIILHKNICGLFHVLAQFLLKTREAELDYYHQKVNVRVAAQDVE